MRAGWNPGRRNRNVGTKGHGHSSNNKLVIPEARHEHRRFYELLSSYVVVKRQVVDKELTFFVEPTRLGWFYPCTVDDICCALSQLPSEHIATFDMVVMRQPTRKQRVLSAVWGRAVFEFDAPNCSGAAVVLEAQTDEPLAWPVSLSPERVRELDRLRADGHQIHKSTRNIVISTTPDSLRNTVLCRTLLHEVGHHVDHSQRSAEEWQDRTPTERENYAHRYAAEMLERFKKLGAMPFVQRIDEAGLLRDGLNPEWFQGIR